MAAFRIRTIRCSFCGKKKEDVAKLISGPAGVYICNECVDRCNEILAHEPAPPTTGA
jgi:ATP-dependent Clp protease ATP-binding subunit ClpX